jgi:hypothetical protein
MAVADVEITMIAVDGDTASPELTTIEREVIVVELLEGYAPSAIFKQAVLEGSFRERLTFIGVVFQDCGIGETAKCQMPVGNFSLKALSCPVMEPRPGLATTIQFEANESGIRHAIQEQHCPAFSPVPDQFSIPSAPDDQPADPASSRRVLEHKRSGNSVGAVGKVEDATVTDPGQGFLQGKGVVRSSIPDGCRINIGFDIDPVRALFPMERWDLWDGTKQKVISAHNQDGNDG